MTTAPVTAEQIEWHSDLLPASVGHAREQARVALLGHPARPLDAVAWASAHLAAFDRVVHPAVARLPRDVSKATAGGDAVAASRRQATRLEHVLRLWERLHSGDVQAAQLDRARLRAQLLGLLDERAALETAMLARLAGHCSPDQQRALVASYRRVLEHAPTRPHPHVPHGGVLGALAFRVDALRDRLLDVMDSRHVPAPRSPRTTREPGRWGLWLLGQPARHDDGHADPANP